MACPSRLGRVVKAAENVPGPEALASRSHAVRCARERLRAEAGMVPGPAYFQWAGQDSNLLFLVGAFASGRRPA